MVRSETRVKTANASRYLQQLCKHWSHRRTVEFTTEEGRVDFGDGCACVMQADEEGLSLTVEAPDAAQSKRLGDVIIEHLRRFTQREEIAAVEWRQG